MVLNIGELVELFVTLYAFEILIYAHCLLVHHFKGTPKLQRFTYNLSFRVSYACFQFVITPILSERVGSINHHQVLALCTAIDIVLY